MTRTRRERSPLARLLRGEVIVVTQCENVAGAIRGALERRRPTLSVVDEAHDEARWCAAALALTRAHSAAALLVALHREIALDDLLRVAPARPALLLAGPALALATEPGLPTVATASLARGLGLPVAATPDELVEVAWLQGAGLVGRSAALRTVVADAGHAALLENRLAREGLRRASSSPLTRPAFRALVRALEGPATRARAARIARACAGADALLVAPGAGGALRLGLPGSGLVASADDSTIRAAASLLALPPAGGRLAPRPPARVLRAACARLDGWSAALSEAQLKPLLEGLGLPSPRERLTGSASRAMRAARAIGLPVVVKAVGPGLHARARLGALVLGVRTAAGARQAFRDVLEACARLSPAPALDGVLVSEQLRLPFAIDLGLLWRDGGLPPLLFFGRRRIAGGAWSEWDADTPALEGPLALTAPLTTAQARWAARWLLRREGGAERPLERFLARFSWLGPAFAGRLRWLRLDTVSPGDRDGRVGPRVIDARALQTASLRDPFAALQV